jgi:transcriptional regulator with XRE-family HTH domain
MATSVKGNITVPTTQRLARLRVQFMASELASRIGARIRHRRLELGIETQRELADRLDVVTISNQVVSNWETGRVKPGDANLRRLAEALDVDVDYFFREDGESQPAPDLMGVLNGSQLDRIEDRLSRLEDAVGAAAVLLTLLVEWGRAAGGWRLDERAAQALEQVARLTTPEDPPDHPDATPPPAPG